MDAVRALCAKCGAPALHSAYHQRNARVLGVLRPEDFSSFLKRADAAGDASASEMLGYTYDTGGSLICLLNLSAFDKNIIERTDVFWEVEAVWVDATDNSSQSNLAKSLREAGDRFIQRAGLTAAQRKMSLSVLQQALPPDIAHDLEIRFGSLRFGVEAKEFLRHELTTKQEAIGLVGQSWDIATPISDFSRGTTAERQAAIKQLVSIGPPAIPALVDKLGSVSWFMRKCTAQTLGMIVDKTVTPALVRNATSQYLSARALIASAVPALIHTMNDFDRDVRESSAEALGKIGLPALPAVIETLKHTETAIPACAAIALKKMGKEAISELEATFNHSNGPAQRNIDEVMGLIRGSRNTRFS